MSTTGEQIHEFMTGDHLRPVYQPVVDLLGGQVVGYEALARGRTGSGFERPQDMFAAARTHNVLPQLDAACRAAAVQGALSSGLRAPMALFVNVEPGGIDGRSLLAPHHEALVSEGALQVVLEFTERELTCRPAELLTLVGRCRELGCAIALDDVGVNPRSLALLPFLEPDVIKLDMRVVQQQAPDRARTLYAVAAAAEHNGAAVLAEGIETEAHRDTAMALGATLGQGRFFGAPAALEQVVSAEPRRGAPAAGHVAVCSRRPRMAATTPLEFLRAQRPVRRGDKRFLTELSRQLEVQALDLGPEAVILASFQHARFLRGVTARRYEQLSRQCALVAAIGVDMAPEPLPRVRGTGISAEDPLAQAWNIAVVSPHFWAAFAAREVAGSGSEPDHYEYAITLDRELVLEVALTLMSRVVATVPREDPAALGPAQLSLTNQARA